MSSRGKLTHLLERILPRAEFYTRLRSFRYTSDSVNLNSEEYRTQYERISFDAVMGHRMPIPSDFIRPSPDLDRFPENDFDRLVALVGQLLDSYTDTDSRSFVAVLPATRLHHDNWVGSVEQTSKSLVRCAALFGVSDSVDTFLGLVEGDTAEYTQVVVLDGVSLSSRTEDVELWPGARLVEWDQVFGDPRDESILSIPDALLTQASHADTNMFRFGRGNTLLCIDRTGGPIIRRSEDAEPDPGGSYVPLSPHQLSTEIAISALSLMANHPVLEICSWHWYDAKVQALVGYRNELALDQNMGGPQLMRARLIGAEEAPLVHNIHQGLSQQEVFERLRVPIQRWRRSKAANNGVDMAIDLRIALESLFLDEGNNAELSFRLALRAAWYLGAGEDERAKIFEAVRDAYKIGSKAVHTGEGHDNEMLPTLAMAQDICRISILRRIREGGKPPNWKDMVLGR